jgi:hypothetical protein
MARTVDGRVLATAVAALAILSAPSGARAADDSAAPPNETARASSSDVRGQIPIVAYAYSAQGVPAGTVGAQAYGLGLEAKGQRAIAGGGGTVWGSPVDRLTLVGDGARDQFGNFAPSAAAMVRLLGDPAQGFTLSALGKFKIEGFGVGPNDELESEVELGMLLSYARQGWHLDANAIGGHGTGDDGDADAEGRLRIGRDLGDLVRVGADGQARYRLAGAAPLLGGRTWDFAAGPQLLVGQSHFFGSLTAGPATMGVASGIGWTAIASVGGVSF